MQKHDLKNDLLTVAERTLRAEDSTPALKAVAAETLLTASREGLPLHPEAIRPVWRWLLTSPRTTSWTAAECIGVIDDPEIREAALDLLRAERIRSTIRVPDSTGPVA